MCILIKGAKMPRTCAECKCYHVKDNDLDYTFAEGACEALGIVLWECRYNGIDILNPFKQKHPNCPLVEIPPHGRLIDADKVVKKMEKIATKAWQEKLSDTVEHTLNMSMDILDDAPTVIESEEEK